MTWHLKDKTLEQALCRTYAGFLEALNHAAELSAGCNYVAVEFNRKLDNGDIHENHLVFKTDELEVIYEYNPKCWNKYPKVIPPENVRMRVEFNFKNEPEKTYHACFYFFSGKWYWDTCKYSIDSSIVNIRYRPWED